MKNFVFEKNNFHVHFDASSKTLKISGGADSLNPYDQYKEFSEWFENYLVNPNKPTHLVFEIEYYNSTFLKYIVKFFMNIENSGYKEYFKVKWFCKDEEIEELATDLQKVSSIKFEITKYIN